MYCPQRQCVFDLTQYQSIHADPFMAGWCVDLCVFCDEPMPPNPSKRLVELEKKLKRKKEITRRWEPTNPKALHLPVSHD